MDVTEIDGTDGVGGLSGPELEERITRAIDPRVPVEVFFALLDRLAAVSGSAAAPSDLEVDDDGRMV